MGNCLGSHVHRKDSKQPLEVSKTLQMLESLNPEVEGQPGTMRLKPTQSGRFLMGASAMPLDSEERNELAAIAENPQAAKHLTELASAAEMGLRLEYSKSSAFIGLLIADVVSADLPGYSAPQAQMLCEDDKSKYVKSDKEVEVDSGKFIWKEARFVFVIVFSHAEIKLNVKEGARRSNPVLSCQVPIADIEQGQREYTWQLQSADKESSGSITLSMRYNWLRNTADEGRRTHIDFLTVDPRKMTGARNIVSHLSNVNHWMMSHDNVWTALDRKHPAVVLARKQAKQRKHEAHGDHADRHHHHHRHLRHRSGSHRASNDNADAGMSVDDDASTVISPTAGGTSVGSDEDVPQWQARVRCQMDDHYGDDVEGGHANPAALMFETSVAESLQRTAGESDDTAQLKSEMASLLALVNDRITALECQNTQQEQTIMHLEHKLDTVQGTAARLPYLSGRFGYGLGRPAVRREVLLFAKKAQEKRERDDWPTAFIGKHRTGIDGKLGPIEVPERIATSPGHYDIVALLPEDNTFARGSLFILRPRSKLVLFDMDGTITVGDQEVVAQFALNAVAGSTAIGDKLLTQAYDQKARAHARTVVRLWAAKGYQPIYLSGRQGSFYNLTLQWLIKHNFPPGPIHLTRTHKPTLPVYASVGNFKVTYMQGLRSKGFDLYAAYGNTGTDARAYEAAGIPKERTFMIGQGAGARGTVKINNWTQHLAWVLDVPDSEHPISNVDLLWASLPVYRKDKGTLSGHHSSAEPMGQFSSSIGSSSMARPSLTKPQKLTTSEVTTAEPKHPADPEEIPASRLDCEATDDEAASDEVPGSVQPTANDNKEDGDAFVAG